MDTEFMKVADIAEIPAGSMKRIDVGGQPVLLSNIGGKFYAIGSVCTHRGGPLEEGFIEGLVVTCPWHGGKFDLTSGKVLGPPPMSDEVSFEVKVEGSSILVRKK